MISKESEYKEVEYMSLEGKKYIIVEKVMNVAGLKKHGYMGNVGGFD